MLWVKQLSGMRRGKGIARGPKPPLVEMLFQIFKLRKQAHN